MKKASTNEFLKIALTGCNDPSEFTGYILASLASMQPYVEIDVKTSGPKKIAFIARIDCFPTLGGADEFYGYYFKEIKKRLDNVRPKGITERFNKARDSYPNDKNYNRNKLKRLEVAAQITADLEEYYNKLERTKAKMLSFRKIEHYPFPHNPANFAEKKKYAVKFIQGTSLPSPFKNRVVNNFRNIPLPEEIINCSHEGPIVSFRDDLYNKRLEGYADKFTSKKMKFLASVERLIGHKIQFAERTLNRYKRLGDIGIQ